MAGKATVVCVVASRGITLVKNDRFDLIVSDVVMPGKDGLSMLADLRELGVSTPIVMISGQATVDMAVRAARLGAADFLEKPISADKLPLTGETLLRPVRLQAEDPQPRRRGGPHGAVCEGQVNRRVQAPGA